LSGSYQVVRLSLVQINKIHSDFKEKPARRFSEAVKLTRIATSVCLFVRTPSLKDSGCAPVPGHQLLPPILIFIRAEPRFLLFCYCAY